MWCAKRFANIPEAGENTQARLLPFRQCFPKPKLNKKHVQQGQEGCKPEWRGRIKPGNDLIIGKDTANGRTENKAQPEGHADQSKIPGSGIVITNVGNGRIEDRNITARETGQHSADEQENDILIHDRNGKEDVPDHRAEQRYRDQGFPAVSI